MIPILMYHQIDAIAPKIYARGVRAKYRSLTVSPSSFQRQMWLLKVLGYRGVSMSELMPYLRGEKTTARDGKVVGITFDDGYQNNLVHALPVLCRYGFSSTCYAVSRLVAKTNSWDSDDAQSGIAVKPLMTALEMRAWIAAGQEIGSHTLNHINLTKSSYDTAVLEMTNSKWELEAMTDKACQHFCYPYGAYGDEHIALAQAAGYLSATTVKHGVVRAGDSHFELPRVGVMKNTNLFQFWRSLSA